MSKSLLNLHLCIKRPGRLIPRNTNSDNTFHIAELRSFFIRKQDSSIWIVRQNFRILDEIKSRDDFKKIDDYRMWMSLQEYFDWMKENIHQHSLVLIKNIAAADQIWVNALKSNIEE